MSTEPFIKLAGEQRCTHLFYTNMKLGVEKYWREQNHDVIRPLKSKSTKGNGPEWKRLKHRLDGQRLST